MLLSAWAVGAMGAVGSTYNIASPLDRQLIAAFEAGDLQEARRLQGLAVKMLRTIARWPFHPAMKEVLKMIGSDCGGCRLPHPSLAPHQVAELRENLQQIGFFRCARPEGVASAAATVDNEH